MLQDNAISDPRKEQKIFYLRVMTSVLIVLGPNERYSISLL